MRTSEMKVNDAGKAYRGGMRTARFIGPRFLDDGLASAGLLTSTGRRSSLVVPMAQRLAAALLLCFCSVGAFAQADLRYRSNAGPCAAGSLCLQNNWFDVSLSYFDPNAGIWRDAGFSGVDIGHEAGLAYFFAATNLEMLVKVLDGNAINGRFWVFAAAATDLGWELRVRDTETGWTNEYHNPPGNRPLPITDTYAFVHDGRTGTSDPEPPTETPEPPEPSTVHCYTRQMSVGLSGGPRMSDRATIRRLDFAIDEAFTPDTYSKIERMIRRIVRELAGVRHAGRIVSGRATEKKVSWGTWRSIIHRPGWISIVRHPERGWAGTQAEGGQQRDYRLLRTGYFHERPWTVLISDDGWNSAGVVIAHELGHAIFGLGHVSDADNIMCTDYYIEDGRCGDHSRMWREERDNVTFSPYLKDYVSSQLDMADSCRP